MVKRNYIDLMPRLPKYMCLSCFRIFSKRYESHGDQPYGVTKRCTCGNEKLLRLDPDVHIPRKRANNKKWAEFFRKQFWMISTAKVYYEKFREIRRSKKM